MDRSVRPVVVHLEVGVAGCWSFAVIDDTKPQILSQGPKEAKGENLRAEILAVFLSPEPC